uniref:Uncharacterized protein n=1 Tax=Cannabis sativa TaxID=3483 RepID=A0A803QRT6_CANSA
MGSLSHAMKWDNRLEHQTKLDVNKIKVNVNGVLFESKGKFGVGAVAYNSFDTLLEVFSMSFHGQAEASFVEVVGIKEAFGWIKRKKGWFRSVRPKHIGNDMWDVAMERRDKKLVEKLYAADAPQ